MSATTFQTVTTLLADRTDHIWFQFLASFWKCALCGALTHTPPPFPTPREWLPEFGYDPLTPEEREHARVHVRVSKPV